MSTVKIYGIKNCDTMKKAFNWLDRNGVAYDFHDYKKEGVTAAILQDAINTHGWENVINRRGTSWRKLPDDVREGMNAESSITAALENPSLVKRPLIVYKKQTFLGFDEKTYAELLG